jgi:hypothetical protein
MGKEVIQVTHNGQDKFFGHLRPVMATLDTHYERPQAIRRPKAIDRLKNRLGLGVSHDNNPKARDDGRVNSIMARYNESEVTPFKDLLYEMPQRNTITRETPGYSISDDEEKLFANKMFDRKNMGRLPSGHRVYHVTDRPNSGGHILVYHPTKNRIEARIGLRRNGDNAYQEQSLAKRGGSNFRIDDVYDHLLNKHGWSIYSDTSHSLKAAEVWGRLRDRLRQSGGQMHHISVNGNETVAGKPFHHYYRDNEPSVFKASPSPNVAERLKKRLGRGKSRTE